jgi:imidazoleglycerol-phosphate dehydratase/histidinol-phosphatase
MSAMISGCGRQVSRQRHTREIALTVSIDLDRSDPVWVETDIGFLNHLLEQLARAGGFSLKLSCEGGPRADDRLVVEDCGLELGAALRAAAGDAAEGSRQEISERVEAAQAKVLMLFRGRPGTVVEASVGARAIGGLPTDLVPEFFHALARALGARIELEARGPVDADVISACFRGVGAALRGVFT